jgi:hypothetical protein
MAAKFDLVGFMKRHPAWEASYSNVQIAAICADGILPLRARVVMATGPEVVVIASPDASLSKLLREMGRQVEEIESQGETNALPS